MEPSTALRWLGSTSGIAYATTNSRSTPWLAPASACFEVSQCLDFASQPSSNTHISILIAFFRSTLQLIKLSFFQLLAYTNDEIEYKIAYYVLTSAHILFIFMQRFLQWSSYVSGITLLGSIFSILLITSVCHASSSDWLCFPELLVLQVNSFSAAMSFYCYWCTTNLYIWMRQWKGNGFQIHPPWIQILLRWCPIHSAVHIIIC